MSIFRRNPNEVNYTGGKKHFLDTIKNSGDGNLLLWRQPEEDFNTNSVLIVNPGEEAIFIKNGEILNVFPNGRYELKTENYPFLSNIRNALSGGISTYNCIVIFVRKSHSMEILWGTESPIQLRDPVDGIAVEIQARGSYKVKIADSALFLQKMIGNNIQNVMQEELYKFFDNIFQRKIKSFIANAVKYTKIETLELSSYLDEFSEGLSGGISSILMEYGVELVDFSISAMDIPMDSPARQKLEDAYAEKRKVGIYGNDYNRINLIEILKNFSNNPGVGEGAGISGGWMIGTQIGGQMGGVIDKLAENSFVESPSQPKVSQPSTSESRFNPVSTTCVDSASPVNDNAKPIQSDVIQNMFKLKELFEQGVLTKDAYIEAINKILDKINK